MSNITQMYVIQFSGEIGFTPIFSPNPATAVDMAKGWLKAKLDNVTPSDQIQFLVDLCYILEVKYDATIHTEPEMKVARRGTTAEEAQFIIDLIYPDQI